MASTTARVAGYLLGSLLCGPVFAQVTQRVSVNSDGVIGNQGHGGGRITPGGRYVAFSSHSTNLVPGDDNGEWDVFLRDRREGTTERVSVSSGGIQGNGSSLGSWISADGRFVCFTSHATNLVPGDTNGVEDSFIHDRLTGMTERASITSSGIQGNNASGGGPITPDGRYVVFWSGASNLDPPTFSGQVYVRDRLNGTTELASLGQGGIRPNHESWSLSISDDGRYVAFVSFADNLVPSDTNNSYDVFVRDRQAGTTERVSVSTTGEQAAWDFDDDAACISGNGRFVAFMKGADNLVPGDTNGVTDVFVRDRELGTTERVSVDADGLQANQASGWPSISANGRYVAFVSYASNLAPEDWNSRPNVFVHDRRTSTNEVADLRWDGQLSNGGTSFTSISADGGFVVYENFATDLLPGFMYGWSHIYVRDRFGGACFTSLCSPGMDDVRDCPCSNPPDGPDRGCDNSAGTGGAALTASGGTFLTSDTLVFRATHIRLGMTCLLLQGKTQLPSGAEFGQGVRCLGGPFERLYSRFTGDGNFEAPNLHFGEDPVSVRSEERGDPIGPGESRYYLVYYRDPFVVGGCDFWRSFNATQTGKVTWSP